MTRAEAMIEAGLQARCIVPGVDWSDGLTEGMQIIERMLMQRTLAAVLPMLADDLAGEITLQTELNVKAQIDRANDALAFEFRGLGEVLVITMKAHLASLAADMKGEG